jgi:hypothetical protein
VTWRATFAAQRRKAQADLIATLEPVVGAALDRKQGGSDTWFRSIVDAARPLFDGIVRDDGGDPRKASGAWALLSLDLANTLTKTKRIDEYSHTVIATFLAGSILSAATIAAARQDEEPFELEWVSMHDGNVRHTHRVADGQRIKFGDRFLVGGEKMRFPQDTRASIKEWINCRCTVAAVPVSDGVRDNAASSGHTDPRHTPGAEMRRNHQRDLLDALTAAANDDSSDGLIPWHGPLAEVGQWSGDRRRFGSLTNRDLPLPLTFQEEQNPGHDGSITAASIDWIDYRDGVPWSGGRMLQNEPADKLVGLMAHFGRYGVSIDADKIDGAHLANEDGSAFDMDTYDPESGVEPYGEVYEEARICSASAVSIPAFANAWIALGPDPEHDYGDAGLDSVAASAVAGVVPGTISYTLPSTTYSTSANSTFAISDGSWDGSASRFTPEQWKRSCVLHLDDSMDKSSHKLPIKEPNGDLSRAGVHAAASRIGQVDAPDDKIAAARRALRSAYSTLGEDAPEGLALSDSVKAEIESLIAGATTFGELSEESRTELRYALASAGGTVEARRGPGWITNPEDTKRIHDYWTVPGEEGYAKIAWGTDGDFERCRTEIGAKIAENSPEDVRFLNQICAQWHHDATGFWPGHAPAETALEFPERTGTMAPAVTLVASNQALPPHEWFEDPQFSEVTPLTMTEEDGMWHISGHLADWTTCHMNYSQPGQCFTPPRSSCNYARFRAGEVLTDDGPVATGPITISTGHAATSLRMRPALAHYDNTGFAAADVACGDDDYGIWVNGWVRPWISEEKRYELRAAPLSGDWRRDPNTGALEMIAALGVNSAGYPVDRTGPQTGIQDGMQVSLVASLSSFVDETETTGDPAGLDEFADKVAEALERRADARRSFSSTELVDADEARTTLAEIELEDA